MVRFKCCFKVIYFSNRTAANVTLLYLEHPSLNTIRTLSLKMMQNVSQAHFYDGRCFSFHTLLAPHVSHFFLLSLLQTIRVFRFRGEISALSSLFPFFLFYVSFFTKTFYTTVSKLHQPQLLSSDFEHSTKPSVLCMLPWRKIKCDGTSKMDFKIPERQCERICCGDAV